MKSGNKRYIGIFSLIFVNLIWAGSFPATAIVVQKMPSVLLTLLRLGTASIILAPFLRLPKGSRWDIRTIFLSVLLGIVGFAMPLYLETEGLRLSTPAMAAISIALEPLFTVIIATVMLREWLPKRRGFAFLLALFGAWAIAGFPRPGAPGYIVGDLLLLLAVLCYGVYNAYSKRLIDRVSASAAASVTLLTGFIATIPIWFLTGAHIPHEFNRADWIALLYLALFATTGAYLIWLFALKSLPASVAALFLYLQPIFGVILSILIVGTRPPAYFYLGSVLILLAIFLGRQSKADTRAENSVQLASGK